MFLITRQKDGWRAIPIHPGDRWDFHKVLPGRREVRIVLRVRGRRHLLYSTCELSNKYPTLERTQLILLCDEIIAILSDKIANRQEYINFEMIAGAVERSHRRHWYDKGLIPLSSLEDYHGHPIDAKTEVLITHVHVDRQDIIYMDHEPPADTEQEELPY